MNSTRYQYDDLARPLKIKRWGVIDSDGETEKFGLLDDLTFEYDGARLSGYGQNPDTYEGEEFFQRVSMPMATATRQYSKGRLSKENGIGDIFYAYNRRGQPKATVSVVAGFPYTETSLVKTHDCHGRLMAKTGTVKQGTQGSVAFDRRYVEGFTFNNGQLERVDFTGGYFDAQGGSHYLLTDRLGSVVLVVSGDCEVEACYGYYPYGEMWRNASGQQRRLAAKERETIAVPGDYCFGPRTYRPGLTLWDTADRYNSKYPWLSPFNYCAANPVNFIDLDGDIVRSASIIERNILLGSIAPWERQYVHFNNLGIVDVRTPLHHMLHTGNFQKLAIMANSPDYFVDVISTRFYDYSHSWESNESTTSIYKFWRSISGS